MNTLRFYDQISGWTAVQAKQLAKQSKEAFGAVSKWTANSMKQIGTIVEGLDFGEGILLNNSVYIQSIFSVKVSRSH